MFRIYIWELSAIVNTPCNIAKIIIIPIIRVQSLGDGAAIDTTKSP